MINFNNAISTNYPYPYIEVDNCFDEDILNNLLTEFPDVSTSDTVMGGRKKINAGSTKFHTWIQSAPTWKLLYDWMNQDEVLHTFISYYSDELKKWDSNITDQSSITTDCFLHIDWSVATDGYVREIHRDTDIRIINFLIFLNDKDWEGGDFNIHTSDRLHGLPHQVWENLPIYKTIEAKKNKAIFFLSTPDSYHSVSPQFNTKSPRRFIYGSYSYKHGDVFNKRIK